MAQQPRYDIAYDIAQGHSEQLSPVMTDHHCTQPNKASQDAAEPDEILNDLLNDMKISCPGFLGQLSPPNYVLSPSNKYDKSFVGDKSSPDTPVGLVQYPSLEKREESNVEGTDERPLPRLTALILIGHTDVVKPNYLAETNNKGAHKSSAFTDTAKSAAVAAAASPRSLPGTDAPCSRPETLSRSSPAEHDHIWTHSRRQPHQGATTTTTSLAESGQQEPVSELSSSLKATARAPNPPMQPIVTQRHHDTSSLTVASTDPNTTRPVVEQEDAAGDGTIEEEKKNMALEEQPLHHHNEKEEEKEKAGNPALTPLDIVTQYAGKFIG